MIFILVDINLVGGQRLGVSGDKTTFMTEIDLGKYLVWTRIFNFGPRWRRFGYGGYLVLFCYDRKMEPNH